jgi:hypothetical protein
MQFSLHEATHAPHQFVALIPKICTRACLSTHQRLAAPQHNQFTSEKLYDSSVLVAGFTKEGYKAAVSPRRKGIDIPNLTCHP